MSQSNFEPLLCLVDLDGVCNVLQPNPVEGHLQVELDGYLLQADPVILAELDRLIVSYNLRPT